MEEILNIDVVIETIQNGGSIKTGVDFVSADGSLLLEKDKVIKDVRVLVLLKRKGITAIPYNEAAGGSILNKNGIPISFEPDIAGELEKIAHVELSDLEKRIKRIVAMRREASAEYGKSKEMIKKAVTTIKAADGEFDFSLIENTVYDLCRFLSANEGGFSFLTKEIFSYEDYLFNHAINVCTVGVTILKTFNRNFSENIEAYLGNLAISKQIGADKNGKPQFMYYMPEEVIDIATGFFLHDIGKALTPEAILNKNGKLTETEYAEAKRHSFEKGAWILEKNGVNNPYVKNVVKYHHAALYHGEENCYPVEKPPEEIPPYVKVAKLADIYDAMTSKTSYKEANNPVAAVTDIFRKYAKKDRVLQVILHSFVKAVGIYPPGSIVNLKNHQMAYVIDATGPIILPFTDDKGGALSQQPEPIDLGKENSNKSMFQIDLKEPLVTPKKAYDYMPSYLREIAFPVSSAVT